MLSLICCRRLPSFASATDEAETKSHETLRIVKQCFEVHIHHIKIYSLRHYQTLHSNYQYLLAAELLSEQCPSPIQPLPTPTKCIELYSKNSKHKVKCHTSVFSSDLL